MYEPNIFNQFDDEQEENEMAYTNEEEIIKMAQNTNMNTESQKPTPTKVTPLKTPIMTYANTTQNERLKTESNTKNDHSKALKSKKACNRNKPTSTQIESPTPPILKSKQGQIKQKHVNANHKKQIENCEITLQQHTDRNEYEENSERYYIDGGCSSQNHQIPMQPYMPTNQPYDINDKEDNEWGLDEQYQVGDVIESNNDVNVKTKSDNKRNKDEAKEKSSNQEYNIRKHIDSHNRSKNTPKNNNDYDNKQDDVNVNKLSSIRTNTKNVTEINPINSRDPNSNSYTNKNRKRNHENEIENQFNIQANTRNTEKLELMIKFQFTEEEYRQYVEAKSKMIMKYLANVNVTKKKY